jgi:hypothetical protein
MKRLRIVLFILALSVSVSQLTGLDHLELMTTLYGEFYGSHFGSFLVSLSFNGDSYDDLIVFSKNWNPYGVYQDTQKWGKIYFYWGSADGIGSTPDFVIEASANSQYAIPHPINGDDINGDGLDDLVIRKWDNATGAVLEVYYGTNTPSATPDLIITAPYVVWEGMYPDSLGDINGDGHADLTIYTERDVDYTIRRIINIWMGDNGPWYTLLDHTASQSPTSTNGVGDVNNDGFDDFILQHGTPGGGLVHDRIVLHYGSVNFPEHDSLVITDDSNMRLPRISSPLGDINGDGFADFETYKGRSWFGDTMITPSWDLTLNFYEDWHNWGYPDYNVGNPFIFGDLNGDGYDDVIGSSYLDTGSYNGQVAIWVGGPKMDGLIDMYLYNPPDYIRANFGWAKAAGDFNGDGLCDLAISAPIWGQGTQAGTEGRVYIYSGNALLEDTSVANDDPVETDPPWELNIYPNPISCGEDITIELSGSNAKATIPVSLELFNLKGQKVCTIANDIDLRDNASITFSTLELASGIYVLRTQSNNILQNSVRICVIK